MKTALISLQALLCAAEPDDPQDAVVANMYKTDRPQFDMTAREWTVMYADPTGAIAASGPIVSISYLLRDYFFIFVNVSMLRFLPHYND
jgi:hypothetical protein